MTGQHPGYDAPEDPVYPVGIRDCVITSYDIPKAFYVGMKGTAAYHVRRLGCMIWYSLQRGRTAWRCKQVNVDEMVARWKTVIVGLACAHSKDEADRHEATIDACLTPMLSAPIKQIREFAPKLRDALKNDPEIPYLVWRAYEMWFDNAILKASDQDVKALKQDLAQQITDIVEQDLKDQLPEAVVRALMWRSPEKLEKVKQIVEKEKAAGRPVRLRGRESCLFLEAGGTEQEPAVCIQI